MNLANKITIFRILLVPVFIILLLYSTPGNNGGRYAALFVFCLAAASDGLDGFVARAFQQKTELGAYLDALADKILLDSAFVLLSYLKMIPNWLTIIVISRDILILGGVVLLRIHTENVEIAPTLTSKLTTFFQMVLIIATLLNLNTAYYLWYLVAVLTIISGIGYLRIAGAKFNGI